MASHWGSAHPLQPFINKLLYAFYVTEMLFRYVDWQIEGAYLRLLKFVKVWCDIEEDSIERTR